MSQIGLTEKVINDFLNKLHEENKSQRVIREYQRNLRSLKEIADKKGNFLSQEILDMWYQEQLKRGLSQGTITNCKVRINHFLRYIGEENLCFPRGGFRDLTGMQFGELTVIEATNRRTPDRSVYWRCRCNACGKEKELPTNQLIKGVQVSCGCRRKEQLQKTNGYIGGTCLKNVFSEKVNRNNTSGYKGVFLKRGKWTAQIQYKKKMYYLGSYDSLEDAVSARREAEAWVREDAKKLLELFEQSRK